jgi:hypothetical protein
MDRNRIGRSIAAHRRLTARGCRAIRPDHWARAIGLVAAVRAGPEGPRQAATAASSPTTKLSRPIRSSVRHPRAAAFAATQVRAAAIDDSAASMDIQVLIEALVPSPKSANV